MHTGFNSIVFGRQTERIPAQRVQNIITAHAMITRHNIGGGVPLGMTNMQPLG